METPLVVQQEVKNPFKEIWYRPLATISWLCQNRPGYKTGVLSMLGGVQYSLQQSYNKSAGDKMDLTAILLIAIILGPVGGWIGMHINSFLLTWTGNWIGGQATGEKIRMAYAWSYLPPIAALAIWVPEILVYKQAFFSTLYEKNALPLVGEVSITLLNIWGMVLFFRFLKEVQQFSIWKVILNGLLSIIIVILPIVLIAGVISFLK